MPPNACSIFITVFVLLIGVLPVVSCSSNHDANDNRLLAQTHRDEITWIDIQPGEYKPASAGAGFIAMLERTGLFEPSGATANAVPGIVRVTSSFEISALSITASAYAEFLNAHQADADRYVCDQIFPNIENSDGRYAPLAGRDSHAANCSTYEGAVAYCTWIGKDAGTVYRLPTESEWIIAEQQVSFPVETDSIRSEFEVANWTSDYYSRTLEAITEQPDSKGPDRPEVIQGHEMGRVARFPRSANHKQREWGTEGNSGSCAGTGFRFVRVVDRSDN